MNEAELECLVAVGSLVENINKNSDSVTDENAKGFLSALKTTVSSTDRATFEAGCLELGQGKNVPFFTKKAKTFFAKPKFGSDDIYRDPHRYSIMADFGEFSAYKQKIA